MSSVRGYKDFVTCPKCRGRIAKSGIEKKLKCYTCQIILTPEGEFFKPIKHINNYKEYQRNNDGKRLDDICLNDIRNYSYRELVEEYKNTKDKGTSRFLRMEAKKDPKYKAGDFVRKRNKYGIQSDFDNEISENQLDDEEIYNSYIRHLSKHGDEELKKMANDVLRTQEISGKPDYSLPDFTPINLKKND